MLYRIQAVILLLLTGINGFAQDQVSSSEILDRMKRLNVLGSVLYVAAHPDDENTRLLTWLNRERNFRTAYLSITRGDGGQNLIGKEQGEMLGLIRTQELIAARKIDGAEQYFTRSHDFGYSKNPEETLNFWNKDTVLSDMVWIIRSFRPDVIICRFPTTGEGGHGHHTASTILALEAFDAAADPDKFPEQLKYVKTWQAKRVFWNTFNFGGNNTTSPDQMQIDVGGFNPLLGKSYGEIAAASRSMHSSQGFGSAPARGSTTEFFKLLKGDSARNDLFDNIDISWKKINKSSEIQSAINDCINKYDVQKPSASVPSLVSLYKLLSNLDGDEQASYWKIQKLREVEDLIFQCAGLFLEVTAANHSSVPGSKVDLTAKVINRSAAEVMLEKISWGDADSALSSSLKNNELKTYKHSFNIPSHKQFSNPYWLNMPHEEGFYRYNDMTLTGNPENEPALSVSFHFVIEGHRFVISRPVTHKYVDPAKGEIERPFEILPPATVNFSSRAFVFENGKARKVSLTVRANVDSLKGELLLNVSKGWNVRPGRIELNNLQRGSERVFDIEITPLESGLSGTISATINSGGSIISKSIFRAEYDHIPFQFMLTEAKSKLASIDLKGNKGTIGYIPGAGDDVAECLAQVGYRVVMLNQEELSKDDLMQYGAVVTGIRAFNTNEWLKDYDSKLLNYVNNGGNLIVQYNTNSRVGPLASKISPYPFNISRERVTDENAAVRFLLPDHDVLNRPNKITAADFTGWIQERGIYFASDIDTAYQKIFSMNDPGDKPATGSLIISKYGKGHFAYTGLAFFRELPAGVPGAYRLFENLLNLPAEK